VTEALVADLKIRTGRSCGSCSLCCKLLKVDDPPFFKPPGKWCPHCRPGHGGCSIYDTRPGVCRGWGCGWLTNSTLGDEWRPTRAKMVVAWEPIGEATRHAWCNIGVDPGSPDAWRRDPYRSQIRAWALNGLRAVNGIAIYTRVLVGPRVFVVLPDQEVEVTRTPFTVVPVGPDHWQVAKFKNEEQARRWENLWTPQERRSPTGRVTRADEGAVALNAARRDDN
jgi:hypothetical protein